MLVGLMALSLGVLGQTEFGKNAVKLISDARTEIAKVVWPCLLYTSPSPRDLG